MRVPAAAPVEQEEDVGLATPAPTREVPVRAEAPPRPEPSPSPPREQMAAEAPRAAVDVDHWREAARRAQPIIEVRGMTGWEQREERASFQEQVYQALGPQAMDEYGAEVTVLAKFLDKDPAEIVESPDSFLAAEAEAADRLRTTEDVVRRALLGTAQMQHLLGEYDPTQPLSAEEREAGVVARHRQLSRGARRRFRQQQGAAWDGAKLWAGGYGDDRDAERAAEQELIEARMGLESPLGESWYERAIEGLAGEYTFEMAAEVGARASGGALGAGAGAAIGAGIGAVSGPGAAVTAGGGALKGWAGGWSAGGYAWNVQQLAGHLYGDMLYRAHVVNQRREELKLDPIEFDRDEMRALTSKTAMTLAVPFTWATGSLLKKGARILRGLPANEAANAGFLVRQMMMRGRLGAAGAAGLEAAKFPLALGAVMGSAASASDATAELGLQWADPNQTYVGDISLDRAADVFVESAIDTIKMTSLHGLLLAGYSMPVAVRRYGQNQAQAAELSRAQQELSKALQEKEEVHVDTLERLVRHTLEDGGSELQSVFIDIQAWNDAASTVGDPAQMAAQMIPDGAKVYSEAAAGGHAIEIPIETYLSHVLAEAARGSKWAAPLMDVVRVHERGLTVQELANAPERIRQRFDAVMEADPSTYTPEQALVYTRAKETAVQRVQPAAVESVAREQVAFATAVSEEMISNIRAEAVTEQVAVWDASSRARGERLAEPGATKIEGRARAEAAQEAETIRVDAAKMERKVAESERKAKAADLRHKEAKLWEDPSTPFDVLYEMKMQIHMLEAPSPGLAHGTVLESSLRGGPFDGMQSAIDVQLHLAERYRSMRDESTGAKQRERYDKLARQFEGQAAYDQQVIREGEQMQKDWAKIEKLVEAGKDQQAVSAANETTIRMFMDQAGIRRTDTAVERFPC